jgi:predicted MFS family arabinose efflux permease
VYRDGGGEVEMSESVDPTGPWRLSFWCTYVLGTLTLAFAWLLAQVPKFRHLTTERISEQTMLFVGRPLVSC